MTCLLSALRLSLINNHFAHCKFIDYSKEALPLFKSTGPEDKPDGGCAAINTAKDATGFLKTCKQLRFWERQSAVDKL